MADVNEIADGIETRLATISGLQVASEWKDQPNPPAAIVLPDSPFDEQTTFSGRFTYRFRVLVITSTAPGVAKAVRALNPYLNTSGATSIRAAIDADTTLGGIAEDIALDGAVWDEVGFIEWNGVTYWGAFLRNIEVYVKD